MKPVTAEKPKDAQISHADQYKMLREEIMDHARDMSKTQLWAGVGAASVYTWLLLHPKEVASGPAHYTWFIPPAIILLCSLRSLNLVIRINSIAKYLQRIETASFKGDAALPGWENYKCKHRWIDTAGNLIGLVAWILGFGGSVVASWFLSR